MSEVVSYWYEGRCPSSDKLLRLPRTEKVEAIARQLMQDLAADDRFSREGKMYGVLLVETVSGEQKVLKAFSGLLDGKSEIEGWVPTIPGRDRIALEEAQTLGSLELIKQEIIQLQSLPERQQYEAQCKNFEMRLQSLLEIHRDRKHQRQQKRLEICDHSILDEESRRDGMERRRLKQERDRILQPLKQFIDQADLKIQALKRRRKVLSQTLQSQMHRAYRITNFAGEVRSLQDLLSAMPTGTGECCAPKLLHYAATQGLKPLAMAEFWWGTSSGDKIQGEFYGACVERCQPMMGFLLSGLPQDQVVISERESVIIYEDDYLIVVDKPAGLLSVPGRYRHTQESVLNQLQKRQSSQLWAVHRLDQDTSGLLMIAKDMETYRKLNHQFQYQKIQKVYEAVLAGTIAELQGEIELPLGSDRGNRPLQTVDWEHGKPCLTYFRVMKTESETTRIEFRPVTGRTHQLRVHAAVGLNAPILGDRLYGKQPKERLYLHARELQFEHPYLNQTLLLKAETPF